ncbi:glycoside hydrolase family 38 C-terminal domain-containing protein [Bailinhaonella thermotolerans]|uniref:Alpha-mannosidase n=1 Tax=Bailinhaonella thermotolerans TaxID=1070861 RepID=A0A3A4B797_9ACTN|nr:glycoside hydrolase family 38 C-terminal domain-containing protein [Bailinhaonella thermotolerans]RJL34447.1 alpha-mannosidase [Bailinhaonella thermotolerans]
MDGRGRREIVIVPHTHWDREWYLPFQRFRLRLAGLLDDVLDRMERDPRHRFTLDGQLAAVDDYLEVRPERRETVAALVREGRLAVGPWRILLDEFLCSGENIIRNLELGLRRAGELGGAMRVGYLPDMFGHAAQMPQILAGAGIRHACVWRGVPASVDRDVFAWTSPDGTSIRTRYLPEGGYGNAAGVFEDPGEPALTAKRVQALADAMEPWRADGGPVLGMYGADHTAPAAGLPDLLEEAARATGVPLRLATLAEFFAGEPETVEGLPEVRGELRSHARANILPGVLSARVHLKRAMGAAERVVERYAEPLAALWTGPAADRFLDMAWHRLIDASCHDSVTGCGCDETAQQVAARLAEAEQLGRAVIDMAGLALGGWVPHDGYLIFNPSPFPRRALVTLDVEGTALEGPGGVPVPAQPLSAHPTLLADDVYDASGLPAVLKRVHGVELYGQEITDWDIGDRELTFHVARRAGRPFDVDDVRHALDAILPDEPGPWRVRVVAAPRTVVAALVEVPPLGHASVRPAAPGSAPPPPDPVRRAGRSLDNGLLRVDVEADGTLTLTSAGGVRITGAARLADGGDLGDTYNYAPPAADLLVTDPLTVTVRAVHDGPLLGEIAVLRTYDWPAAGDFAHDARSRSRERVTVTTAVSLRAGEPFARLRITFDNRAADHRLRLHVPLPRHATTSYAEGQYAVTERGTSAEGGCGEHPLPTFPASGFVAAGGAAVLLTHPTEYELTADGAELAVTLLRSVGLLSRNRHRYRDEPAGPQIPAPEAQCRGDQAVDLALLPYDGEWHESGILRAAEEFRHDLLPLPGWARGTAALPRPEAGLSVTGDGVVLGALRRRDEWTEVRLISQTPEPTRAHLTGPFTEARHCDLLGAPTTPLKVADGRATLPLRPWQIATVHLKLP